MRCLAISNDLKCLFLSQSSPWLNGPELAPNLINQQLPQQYPSKLLSVRDRKAQMVGDKQRAIVQQIVKKSQQFKLE
jgi:hypothetical protein